MKTRQLRLYLVGVWEPILLLAVGLITVSTLLLYKLGTLVPAFSRPEVVSFQSSKSLNLIIDNPLNAPYKVLVFGLNQIGRTGAFELRLITVMFSIITLFLLYYIVSNWHDRRTAVTTTLIFACSAWFLHYARIATPDITSTLLLAAMAYGYWIRKTKRSNLVSIFGLLIAITLLYVPGLIWFVILGGIWQSKQIGGHLKDAKLSIPILILLPAILLAPLVIAISRDPALLKNMAGLPAVFSSPYDTIKQMLNVPVQLFLRGPNSPAYWLGRLPLLDIFTATMSVIGAYAYYHYRQLDRTRLLIGVFAIGTILVGFGGSVSIIILAPFVYLLVAAGIAYLINQWLVVFPRNPLAKAVGIGLVTVAVLFSCFYNLRQYFVAWPSAPPTKLVYRQQIR